MLHVYLFALTFAAGWALVRAGNDRQGRALRDLDDPVEARAFRERALRSGLRRPPSPTVPVAAFGAAGLAALAAGAGGPAQLAIASVVGLLAGLAAAFFPRGGEAVRAIRTGRVTVGIPAGGVGEIAWIRGAESGSALARTADGGSLPPGTEVRVVALDAGGVVVTRAEGEPIPAPARERAAGP